jgi:hypothetical protein
MLNRSAPSLGSAPEQMCSAVVAVAMDLALGVGFDFFGAGLDLGSGWDFGAGGTCGMNFIEI